MLLIGSQVGDKKSLLSSLQDAVHRGANVAQVFLRDMSSASPQGRKHIPPGERKSIRTFIKTHDLHVFVHASYLLHFCRHEIGYGGIQWAYQILREDMALAEELGMKGVVLHMCSTKRVLPGSITTRTIEETEHSMIGHIRYFLSRYGSEFPHVMLLLENSAGENHRIGKNLKELGAVFRPLAHEFPGQVGICLDTCHAFAAGNPVTTVRGLRLFMTRYKKEVGPWSTLKLIHLNDSAYPWGAKKDRHAGIGQGYLFSDKQEPLLREIVRFAAYNSIPLCLETHADYTQEIALLRSLFLQEGGGKKTLPMKNLLEDLEEIQQYHESLGNKREADQYKKVLSSLRTVGLKEIRSLEDVKNLPFVGKGTLGKIQEKLETGSISLLELFRKDPQVQARRTLTGIFDVGPVTAKKWADVGILSLSQLHQAVKKKKIHLTQAQQVGLKYYDDLQKRIPRKEAEEIAKYVKRKVKTLYGKKAQVILAGSYRTGKSTLGDVDLVIATPHQKPVLRTIVQELLEKIPDVFQGKILPSPTQDVYMGIWKEPRRPARHVDIHVVSEKELPFHLLYFGSGESFSRKIRQYAKEKGYRLTHKELLHMASGKSISLGSEEEIFAYLGLVYVPPKERIDIRKEKE